MKRTFLLVSLVLLGIACGPPGVQLESSTNTDSTESGDPSGTGESSTSESSTDESDTGNAESIDSGFVPVEDIYVPASCDPFAQDCPEGEKCVPYGSTGGNWDANKCVPVLGDQAVGEPCKYDGTVEATDDCDETSFCWDVMDVEGEAIGICQAFCLGSAERPECPPGSQCLITGSSTINICTPTCDPMAQDCGDGLGCYWANNGFNCIFTTEDLPTGEPCSYINDCAAGVVA